jgi:hypothetical protein
MLQLHMYVDAKQLESNQLLIHATIQQIDPLDMISGILIVAEVQVTQSELHAVEERYVPAALSTLTAGPAAG